MVMATGLIWGGALALYVLFRLWYDNWRGPLTRGEIDHFLSQIEGRAADSGNSLPILRSFLEEDDGREFVMLNLVKVHGEPVADPAGGPMMTGIALLQRYSRRFMRVLLRNGGHPGMVGRKVGGYVDAWNTAPDPGWSLFGLMRYRSRRDMMKLAVDPAFTAGHLDKLAATATTFSFPTHRVVSLYIGPRVSVALLLALIAALAHLALLTL